MLWKDVYEVWWGMYLLGECAVTEFLIAQILLLKATTMTCQCTNIVLHTVKSVESVVLQKLFAGFATKQPCSPAIYSANGIAAYNLLCAVVSLPSRV